MKHLDNADYDSITYELRVLLGKEDEEVEHLSASKFCDEHFPGISPRLVLKNIRFNRAGLKLVKFIMKQEYTVTKPITVYSESGCARCKVTLVKNPELVDLEGKSFFMKDLCGLINEYAIIDGLESMDEGHGIRLLNDVVSTLGDMPIFIQAGYLYIGDYNSLDYSKELFNLPEELAAMYQKFGFKNVNEFVGNYEDSIMMFHGTNGDLMRVRREDSSQSFLKAVNTMGGNPQQAVRHDEGQNKLSYYEQGKICFEQASIDVGKDATKFAGIRGYITAMLYYINSLLEVSSTLSDVDKQKSVDMIKTELKESYIDHKIIVSIVSSAIKPGLTSFQCKAIIDAIAAYNILNENNNCSAVDGDCIASVKTGALAIHGLLMAHRKV